MRLLHLIVIPLTLLAGCASAPLETRPFFQAEQELETHGRKTWLDLLIETDPGGVTYQVADDYETNPPRTIAVLPFADQGNGEYLVNKISVVRRTDEERAVWSWTHANRLRRAVTGTLGSREFVVVPLLGVDAILAEHGITDSEKLAAVPVAELGRWLGADAVVYGELIDYEAYYAFLVTAWRMSARITMVSTLDGHEFFSCYASRYSSTISPALDPIDVAINSAMNLLMFRDITLARAEYEVGREIVLRLPRAEKNIAAFRAAARGGEWGYGSEMMQPIPPLQPVGFDVLPPEATAHPISEPDS